jgi:signal transduction histidine kinase
MAPLSEKTWRRTIERAQRNVNRIMEIQDQVDDIIQEKRYETYDLLSLLLDQCTDALETLMAEEVGEGPVVERVREQVEETFGPKEMPLEEIFLDRIVKEKLEGLKPLFSHRRVEIITRLESTPPIYMPVVPLQKVIDGLVKNAIENTPDEGWIKILVHQKGAGSELVLRDYGVGITEEHQGRIFEGFFTTRDTEDYSTKRPFDFNAGGRGADLLRMKIFSERYNFKIEMVSSRCKYIPQASDICPGKISDCPFCTKSKDCHESGGTTFSILFQPVTQTKKNA